MWVLEEVFRFRAYEPPAEVRDRLARLGRSPRIVDLGGHVGLFGLFMVGLYPAARIVSFEPNPGNASVLRDCVERNGLRSSWRVVEACAATAPGSAELAASFHLSRVGPSDGALEDMHHRIGRGLPFLRDTALLGLERRAVEARDVFPELADADLVKIDVEGAEWELLADPRFAQLEAAAVVLEYHPLYGPGDDAEATVRRAFEAAGYETGRPAQGDGAALIWAWKAAGPSPRRPSRSRTASST